VTPGHVEEFFRRLARAGGPPPTWDIYPHANGDGKALHVVHVEDEVAIRKHLAQFSGFYEAQPLIEILESPASPG
jgi:hypothetical protein